MRQLRLPVQTSRPESIFLGGGLDLVTPLLRLKPGYLRDALNWEQSVGGGYTRCAGYERKDGRPSPSAAQYGVLTVTLTGTVTVGATITGATSSATGVVISVTGNLVAYTKAAGTFVAAENITISGSPVATITALGGVSTATEWDITQRALAANVYRSDIQAVPGSGAIRGVAYLKGELYAWRDNAGGTALAIYKATTSGWTLVPYPYTVSFTAGTTAYAPGSTLTQGGVSATVRAVCVQSGTFSAGTAAGRLIISAPTGGNFAAGAATGTGACTLSGAQVQITALPGGRVQTDKGNFGLGQKLYGCDGVNLGFEFDGTTYVPIVTGNSPDVPKHVCVHKDHLWFAFGDNLQHSSIASNSNFYPQYNWQAVNGSAAYRVNGTITSLARQSGDQSTGVMLISTDTTTEAMYGSSAANFQKVPFEESAGARPYGTQRIGGQTVIWSDIGAFGVSATQNFGNFTPASMTLNLRPWVQPRRSLVSASLIHRTKSQYRVFFSDGSALFITLVNGKMTGAMPQQFPHPVVCACQGETTDSGESAFFGSTNGFVYEMNAGTSHDGDPIQSYLTLAWANQGNSQAEKRYRGASFEVQGDSPSTFSVSYDLGYAEPDRPQGVVPQAVSASLQSVYWDSFTWDAFTWDGRTLAPADMRIDGTGVNIAIRIESTSDRYAEFTLNSLMLHYSPRKAKKH
ncbi:MAG: hypothetical protein IIZ92_02135 [Aquincola sp.]|nr:hypothetical protein [Aquincola sp.]